MCVGGLVVGSQVPERVPRPAGNPDCGQGVGADREQAGAGQLRAEVGAERRNDGTTERRNDGTTERRNDGTTERRNDGTSRKIGTWREFVILSEAKDLLIRVAPQVD